jgi:hypothetical protein
MSMLDALASVTESARKYTIRKKREVIGRFINDERAYQDERWSGHEHEIETYLVYIESYVNEAKELLARNRHEDVLFDVQHILRKIIALGVACAEQHGIQPRSARKPEQPYVPQATDGLGNSCQLPGIPAGYTERPNWFPTRTVTGSPAAATEVTGGEFRPDVRPLY